jgi:hypothetical protein
LKKNSAWLLRDKKIKQQQGDQVNFSLMHLSFFSHPVVEKSTMDSFVTTLKPISNPKSNSFVHQ